MDLNISKAKLTKKGCLEVVYADKEGNDIVFKGINPVHPGFEGFAKQARTLHGRYYRAERIPVH